METKRVYIWVKEDGDSSYQLYSNEDFFGEEIGSQMDSRFSSYNGVESFALKAKSSVLFSMECADRIENIPNHSVYGITKPSANGVNRKKKFHITNNNGKPLILNSGGYAIYLDCNKNVLTVVTYQQGRIIEKLKRLQMSAQPVMDRSNLIRKINKELQDGLDFKTYWENRHEMKDMYNTSRKKYENNHKHNESDILAFIQAFKKAARIIHFDMDQLMREEILFFQKQLGMDNQYSIYLEGLLDGQDNRLDHPFDEYVLDFWFTIKASICIDVNSIDEIRSHLGANTHLDFLKATEKVIGFIPVKAIFRLRSKLFNHIVKVMEMYYDEAKIRANPDIAISLMSQAETVFNGIASSTKKLGSDEIERIFMALSLSSLKSTSRYEIVKIVRKSPLAEDFQVAYNEFRNKNIAFFNVPDLHFFYFKEEKATVLSEQDVCCEYGAVRKTYHFSLSVNQLNQLYSKLRDEDCLDSETDIRDLSSNLIGKYDGNRHAKVVDWKGKNTDLAIMIGVLMDNYDSKDSWSCSERLFTVNGKDIEWQTLNVLYNRYKNQPPRTPNKVMRLMDEVLGDDFTSKIPKGGNTKGE